MLGKVKVLQTHKDYYLHLKKKKDKKYLLGKKPAEALRIPTQVSYVLKELSRGGVRLRKGRHLAGRGWR